MTRLLVDKNHISISAYLENMNACRLGYLPSSQIESARSFLGRSFQNEIMR